MEKGYCVKDISECQKTEGVFLVGDPHLGQGRNGSPYWSLKLIDASGTIEAKIWHPLSSAIKELSGGVLAQVSGHTSKYRDQLQFVIDHFYELTQEETRELDMGLFMRSSPFSIEAMFTELREICSREFTHAPWLTLIFSILDTPDIQRLFKIMPAAKNVHHAYAGGLLEHTLGVVRLCRFFADNYADLDKQTLLAGAILHDLGKIHELSGPMNTEYTQAGRLLGHIFLGIEIIEPFIHASGLEPELCEHLRHLILSHHGELEYGAARLPQTPEAFALHYADNLDAKMAQCRGALDGVTGSGFGAWQATLNRGIFRAMPSPAQPVPMPNPSLPANDSQEDREVFFEDDTEIGYGGAMPPEDDDAPMYDAWEIPAEVVESSPVMERNDVRAKSAEREKPAQRNNTQNREGQGSLF